jgi:hypothetical protein
MRPNQLIERTATSTLRVLASAAHRQRYASLPHATKAVSASAAFAPSRRARSGRVGVPRIAAARERSIASVARRRLWPRSTQGGLPRVVGQACMHLDAWAPAPPPIAGRMQAPVQIAVSSRKRGGFVVGAMHNPSLQPTAFGRS